METLSDMFRQPLREELRQHPLARDYYAASLFLAEELRLEMDDQDHVVVCTGLAAADLSASALNRAVRLLIRDADYARRREFGHTLEAADFVRVLRENNHVEGGPQYRRLTLVELEPQDAPETGFWSQFDDEEAANA